MTKMEQNLLLFQPAITWLVVICINMYAYIGCKCGTRPPAFEVTEAYPMRQILVYAIL